MLHQQSNLIKDTSKVLSVVCEHRLNKKICNIQCMLVGTCCAAVRCFCALALSGAIAHAIIIKGFIFDGGTVEAVVPKGVVAVAEGDLVTAG